MTGTTPDLETRVEGSLLRVLRDAFPGIPVFSFTDPGEREGTCLGVRVESGAENPIGTNIFDVAIEIEARNFDAAQRQLLADMIGNAYNAKETVAAYAGSQYVMPQGQPIEMVGAPRTVEDQNERVVTYSLTASIQPI